MKKWYKKCPYCANKIKEWAVKCSFCEEFLDGRKTNNEDKNKHNEKRYILIYIIWIIILFLLGIVLYNSKWKQFIDNEFEWVQNESTIKDDYDQKDAECKEIGKAAIRARLHERYAIKSEMWYEDGVLTDDDHTISNIDYFYSYREHKCLYSYIVINHSNKNTFLEIEEMGSWKDVYQKMVKSDSDYTEWKNVIEEHKERSSKYDYDEIHDNNLKCQEYGKDFIKRSEEIAQFTWKPYWITIFYSPIKKTCLWYFNAFYNSIYDWLDWDDYIYNSEYYVVDVVDNSADWSIYSYKINSIYKWCDWVSWFWFKPENASACKTEQDVKQMRQEEINYLKGNN